MAAVGIVLAVLGVLLVWRPITVARAANALRFVPYSTQPVRVRQYRIAGGVIALFGLILALTM